MGVRPPGRKKVLEACIEGLYGVRRGDEATGIPNFLLVRSRIFRCLIPVLSVVS
jgi:hypothetical protein